MRCEYNNLPTSVLNCYTDCSVNGSMSRIPDEMPRHPSPSLSHCWMVQLISAMLMEVRLIAPAHVEADRRQGERIGLGSHRTTVSPPLRLPYRRRCI